MFLSKTVMNKEKEKVFLMRKYYKMDLVEKDETFKHW